MKSTLGRTPNRGAPIPAVRTIAALLGLAAAATAFGLLTGNPEPGPVRAAQPVPAPAAQARAVESSPATTAEGDGNVFMYY
jgi:hypothetical protein